MEASTGVIRRSPSITGAGAAVRSNFSCGCSKSVMLKANLMKDYGLRINPFNHTLKWKKKLVMGCGFYDEGYMEYYNNPGRGIRCGKKKEKDLELKKTKKKMKLIKGLSRDLSNLNEIGFGSDISLVDQVQGMTISEASDVLLRQLQQLKAEEKELKRKRKEEKSQMKMKVASEVQNTRNCEMSSSSSSSSESSESSDDECQNLVDMKSLKLQSLAQTIPEACDRALENATSSPALSTIVEFQTPNPSVEIPITSSTFREDSIGTTTNLEVPASEQKGECCLEASDCHNGSVGSKSNASVEIPSTSSTSTENSIGTTTSLEVPAPEQKGECCLEASDCHIANVGSRSNASVAAATTTTAAGTKRIEVCMGGKCKKSGAGVILEELQRVVGMEAAVSGCKCMGKCKVGPNVRVSGCSSSTDTFQAGDSVAASSPPPTTSNSLCIGVGLEDVSLIAANLLGGSYEEVGLANAVP